MVLGAGEPAEAQQLLISRLKVRFLPRSPSLKSITYAGMRFSYGEIYVSYRQIPSRLMDSGQIIGRPATTRIDRVT
jgi:hypothetical protein